MRSSGVAPALRLVAGNVVAAVESPVRRVVSHPAPAKPATTPAVAGPAAVPVARPAPVHGHAQHGVRASRSRVASSRKVTTPAAAATISPVTKHSRGKAKALGQVRKSASHSKPAIKAAPKDARMTGAGHLKAHGRPAGTPRGRPAVVPHGRPADVPHGPPAVPPGQEKKGDTGEQGVSAGRGGGR